MRESILSLGNWGIIIAIALVHVMMTIACGIRGQKRPYSYSFKQGTILATGISSVLIVGMFIHFWAGMLTLIGMGALLVKNKGIFG